MYKLVIPTAGLGSRIGPYTKFKNKALVSVGDEPAIARVIDQFPNAEEIIVLLGYEGDSVRDALELIFPDKNLRFIEVSPYEGEGSGLGVTLNHAKEYLQCPFIFTPNDTIVTDLKFTETDVTENWLVYYEKHRDDGYRVDDYRTISIMNGLVSKIHNKGDGTDHIYTGLCGIYDFNVFWSAMEADIALSVGEVVGLSALDDVKVIESKGWFDCGNLHSLRNTKRNFAAIEHEILEKEDEAIWFVKDRVIKFSKSQSFISDRIKRLNFLPKKMLPNILEQKNHCYSYKKVNGEVFTKVLNGSLVKNLLDCMQKNVWSNCSGSLDKSILKEFYEIKTKQRVNSYHSKYEFLDREIEINGVKTPVFKNFLDAYDWVSLNDKALPGGFHGDFHNENVLVNDGKFKLLDWRQNFGSENYALGDVYYDLAKFMHGFIVSHPIVNKELFEVNWLSENKVEINIHSSLRLSLGKRAFEEWLIQNDYDVNHVNVMAALIFANIATLHEQPYGEFLYLLSRYLFANGEL